MSEPGPIYNVRLRERGQVTIPRVVRERLAAGAGDVLTLIQIEDVVILTTRVSRVATLGEAFQAEMDAAGVTLADLLAGLEEERARSSAPPSPGQADGDT